MSSTKPTPEQLAADSAARARVLEELAEKPLEVSQVGGSSAGAGSGDFHHYRRQRRNEMARVSRIDKEHKVAVANEEYRKRRIDNQAADAARTSKKAAKRAKKKQKQKEKKQQTQRCEAQTTTDGPSESAKNISIPSEGAETTPEEDAESKQADIATSSSA